MASPSVTCVGPRTQVDVLVGPTAIAHQADAPAFSVWPNPTRGVITVGLEQVSGEAMLEVLDVAGRTVYTTNLDRTMQGQAIVDLSGLAAE